MDIKKFKEECKRSPRLTYLLNDFAELAAGVSGVPKTIPRPDELYLTSNNKLLEFWQSHKNLWGSFDSHFFSSIPFILEEECRLGSTILSYASTKKEICLYTIGTAEATMSRTLGKLGKGAIKTLSCSPNIENKINFEKKLEHNNSFFHHGSFYEIDKEFIKCNKFFKNKFDIIIEDTTFQMYSPCREKQINYISNILKDDGIMILIEKMNHKDINVYKKYESIKDDFKEKYFSKKQINDKNKIIFSMNPNQRTLEEIRNILKLNFPYIVLYWNSCNFYSVACSKSKVNLDSFINIMPKQHSPYVVENIKLPRLYYD